ncbi:stage II sporulation protein M [Candidatus Pacearchaeota archaeon]|nr:stage II sporulation protein M [Candidatus Pacearchaeota archaeon]
MRKEETEDGKKEKMERRKLGGGKENKKRSNTIKEQYKLAWNYIVNSKRYIYFIVALFVIFLIIGYFLPVFFVDEVIELVSKIIDETEGMGFFELFVFIFYNNLKTSLISIIAGIAFGIFSIFNTIVNSYLIGFVGRAASEKIGAGVLFRLVPHGIFELPSFILSLGLGLRLGLYLFLKKKGETFSGNLENVLRVFIFVILPLLLIAAFIETMLIVVIFPSG